MSNLFEQWHDDAYPDETRVVNKYIREEAFEAGMQPFVTLLQEMDMYLDTNKLTNIAHGSGFHRAIKTLLAEESNDQASPAAGLVDSAGYPFRVPARKGEPWSK